MPIVGFGHVFVGLAGGVVSGKKAAKPILLGLIIAQDGANDKEVGMPPGGHSGLPYSKGKGRSRFPKSAS